MFLTVCLYALLPAAGNLIGAILAENVRTPRWVVGAALHGSAGITIALISVDLTPRIVDAIPMWLIALTFVGGAGISYSLARGLATTSATGSGAETRAWMVYIAIGSDLFADGVTTGAGSAVELRLGLLLSAAQLVANIPGGFAATSNLKARNVGRRQRMMAAVAMCVPVVASAAIGFLLLRDAPDTAKLAVLSVIVGILLVATVEDMIPEGDAPRPPRWSSTSAFTAGFIALALSAGYLN
jgi:ZIP family zinc transporter